MEAHVREAPTKQNTNTGTRDCPRARITGPTLLSNPPSSNTIPRPSAVTAGPRSALQARPGLRASRAAPNVVSQLLDDAAFQYIIWGLAAEMSVKRFHTNNLNRNKAIGCRRGWQEEVMNSLPSTCPGRLSPSPIGSSVMMGTSLRFPLHRGPARWYLIQCLLHE